LGLILGLLVGCASGPPRFDQALMADQGTTTRNQGVVQAYHVFCPDVLEFRAAGRPDLSGRRAIDSDGRIDLGKLGRLRIEGQSLPQVVNLLSEEIGIPSDRIQVRVAEYNSQQIYLFGQVMPPGDKAKTDGDDPRLLTGLGAKLPRWNLAETSQRAVPYQGPETVLDLLQRVGGITPGAAPNDVHVVRSRLADNQPPQVFHIDLRAIVVGQHQSPNMRSPPFDQVSVGAAKRSGLETGLPRYLRPAYEKLCGIRRPGSFSYGDPLPVQTLKANIAARNMSPPTIFRGAADPD
jgi:protein involved in polysaccharide export with SLBB domain